MIKSNLTEYCKAANEAVSLKEKKYFDLLITRIEKKKNCRCCYHNSIYFFLINF